MAAAAAPLIPADLKVLHEIREMFNAGFMTNDEYNTRRLELIDELTNTVRSNHHRPSTF